MTMRNRLTTQSDVHSFVLAGDAILTLHSRKTDNHYTYRVREAKSGGIWFVQLLTGPDNTNDYTYLGCLRGQPLEFALTKKSKLPMEATPIKAFRFMWRAVQTQGEMPKDIDVYHEGRCGKCGRKLTVPESLERGIGPECANKMGLVVDARSRIKDVSPAYAR
jgi:Family of unknown function (DUF6011)